MNLIRFSIILQILILQITKFQNHSPTQIEKTFILPKEMAPSRYKEKTEASFHFMSLRNDQPLVIEVGGTSNGMLFCF